MGRKPTPQPLNLAEQIAANNNDTLQTSASASLAALSLDTGSHFPQRSAPLPTSSSLVRPHTGTSPRQPADFLDRQYPQTALEPSAYSYPPPPPPFESSPSLPLNKANQNPTGLRRPSRSGFFSFGKGNKAAFQESTPAPIPVTADQLRSRDGPESDSVLPLDTPASEPDFQPPSLPFSSRSELSLSSAGEQDASGFAIPKKPKTKSFGRLGRTKSTRDREAEQARPLPTTVPATPSIPISYENSAPLRTAPIQQQDRAFRDMMSSASRNRSEDRAVSRDASSTKERMQSSSYKDNGASTFFSGLRDSSTRAAGMFGRGLFGKNSRSGSTTEKESAIDDEHYEIKVINLPLVEQTRKTRISKRLESSRDKTEFWMPAFPWRAIDYLNYKGTDVEGLYRVPGSGPQIKKWQRKFDELHDVNLFEAEDLYDINIIGSMLKAWLRELPDELFPKDAQERIARECAGAEEVPQMLIDELSNLSPFNYYLLFAITCHLSLLLAHSEKNKMDFRNLCICFQPCMKIDAFCFKFLVCDWRNCWKGCKNEAQYIEEEYKLFDQPPPRGLTDAREAPSVDGSTSAGHETSSQRSVSAQRAPQNTKPDEVAASAGMSMDNHKNQPNNERAGTPPELRPLSPIKPLSPLGF